MITSGWVEPETTHDMMAGNEPGHGIHFGTSIISVHKRAQKLFGLVVMDDPGCTPFRFDAIPRKELVDFPAPIPYLSDADFRIHVGSRDSKNSSSSKSANKSVKKPGICIMRTWVTGIIDADADGSCW